MSLLTDIEKTHERIWAEDDAIPRDPDHHETLRHAMDRLGLPRGKDRARALGRYDGFDVLGDAEAWELDDGTIVVSSYPGASAIWTPKKTTVRVRIELDVELEGVGKDDPLGDDAVRAATESLLSAAGLPPDCFFSWSE